MINESGTPSLVSEGSHLKGEVTFFSEAGVYGIVEGTVIQQSSEEIRIGRGGWVRGGVE
jgi:cytoskeletal protein CcmA (bactofilin family)